MLNNKYRLRDAVPYAVNLLIQKMREAVDTGLGRLTGAWWKVGIGKSVAFRGLPIFRRHPTARIKIGDHCIFNSAQWSNTIGLNRRCIISATRGAEIDIGNHSGFSGTVIAASERIVIGHRVLCGGNCTIVDTDRHPLEMEARIRKEQPQSQPITIEDDVFLGMNVTVLKGSHIGKGSVIAANSVVAGRIPAGVIAAGSPAKAIKTLST